jgi:hypothetical protein
MPTPAASLSAAVAANGKVIGVDVDQYKTLVDKLVKADYQN